MEATRVTVLLTVAETSKRMRVSKSTVYREVDAGELRAHRIGPGKGVLRIPEDAVDEYLTARIV